MSSCRGASSLPSTRLKCCKQTHSHNTKLTNGMGWCYAAKVQLKAEVASQSACCCQLSTCHLQADLRTGHQTVCNTIRHKLALVVHASLFIAHATSIDVCTCSYACCSTPRSQNSLTRHGSRIALIHWPGRKGKVLTMVKKMKCLKQVLRCASSPRPHTCQQEQQPLAERA